MKYKSKGGFFSPDISFESDPAPLYKSGSRQAPNLRKEARDRECQIRLVSVCNGNSETVVLAHYRLAGVSGMGIKPPDLIGAHACSACHAYVDSHKDTDTQLAFAHGVFRTQALLLKEGKL